MRYRMFRHCNIYILLCHLLILSEHRQGSMCNEFGVFDQWFSRVEIEMFDIEIEFFRTTPKFRLRVYHRDKAQFQMNE